ncbi:MULTISPECIES: hypothetical protein [Roseobacteraceae]|uniref:hypothetical protein n=1 Tax=Roseobacteraceae TaxID=2854170 RepID=UPI00125F4957|nr:MULTISPECIES: hypothetical protein [Roseobacteraceae]
MAMFLGMSLSIGGVGGLLSGILARSFHRAMMWTVGFGVLDTVLLTMTSATSRFAPELILIAVFWGLVDWFVVGRFLQDTGLSRLRQSKQPRNKQSYVSS